MSGINLGIALGAAANTALRVKQLQDDEERQKRLNEEADLRIKTAKQADEDQLALRRAATPVQATIGANGMTLPDSADNRDVGQPDVQLTPGARVGTTAYPTAEAATQAADAQNTPGAVALRQAQVLQSQGRPEAAIKLTRDQSALEREQEERRRTVQNEGLMDTIRPMLQGDAAGVKAAFNRRGDMKIDGDVKVTREDRELPGVGKIPTFTYEGTVVGKDGTKQPVKINSHDFAMSMLPFKDQLDLRIKGTEAESKQALRTSQGETAAARAAAAEKTAEAAEARANAAVYRAESARLGADGKGDSEDRKRWTSLYSEAGRQLVDANKTLRQLQGDVVFMSRAKNPDSPEAKRLQAANDDVTQFKQDRELFGTKLAGGSKVVDAARDDAGMPPKPGKAAAGAKPDISKVQGAPKGSAIGVQTPKGWEVKDGTGKVIGYVR